MNKDAWFRVGVVAMGTLPIVLMLFALLM